MVQMDSPRVLAQAIVQEVKPQGRGVRGAQIVQCLKYREDSQDVGMGVVRALMQMDSPRVLAQAIVQEVKPQGRGVRGAQIVQCLKYREDSQDVRMVHSPQVYLNPD
jgi:hypothetical protein